ncbi:MAG: GNAT family N-acetyltransferase [Candidatus Promineifilaceae bacterium]
MSTDTPIASLRAATLDDVETIAALVEQFVQTGDLLPRSAESIRLTINDWVVALLDDDIVGIGSLLQYTAILVEVRSLAVLDSAQGFGFGRKIVNELVEMARGRNVPTVFALTRAVPFFIKCGFTVTEKENFPEKIWHVCRICPIRDNCDEIAVVLPLEIANVPTTIPIN